MVSMLGLPFGTSLALIAGLILLFAILFSVIFGVISIDSVQTTLESFAQIFRLFG